MSIGHAHLKYTFSPSGLPNVKDLDDAIAQKLKVWKISTGWQLPYCMGYNEAGTIVYVDESVPEFWVHNGRQIKIWNGAGFVHETTEKDYLLRYGEKFYDAGHSIATYLEDTYVRANGGDPIAYEQEFWKPIIAACAKRASYRVPKDLDLAPYHDSSDEATIAKMRFV